MRQLITILLLSLSLAGIAQPQIPTKSYTKQSNTTPSGSSLIFKAGGYADYNVTASKNGSYTFTIQCLNDKGKATYVYFKANNSKDWISAAVPVKPIYQAISARVNLSTSTSSIRIYFGDAVTTSYFTYNMDAANTSIDITPILDRLAVVERSFAEMQNKITELASKPGPTGGTVDLAPIKEDISDIRSQLSDMDLSPILQNITDLKAAIDTLPAITMTGFNSIGKNNFENSPLRVTQAQRTALKVGLGFPVYQTDAVKGLYILKEEGWVFVK